MILNNYAPFSYHPKQTLIIYKGFLFYFIYFLQICNSLGLFDGRILKLKLIKNQKFHGAEKPNRVVCLFIYLLFFVCLFLFGYYLTPCIGLSSVDLNQAFHICKCCVEFKTEN